MAPQRAKATVGIGCLPERAAVQSPAVQSLLLEVAIIRYRLWESQLPAGIDQQMASESAAFAIAEVQRLERVLGPTTRMISLESVLTV